MKSGAQKSMITNLEKDKYLSPSITQGVLARVLRGARLPLELLVKGSLPLLVFTALNELASNLVFVSLMERANAVGRGASSVGVVLIIQCVAQLFLGSWAGSFVDRLGTRKAATIGTIAQAVLTIGLILSRSVAIVYILAFNLMLARLFIIPARLALVRTVTSRTKLLGVNTAIEVLTGTGLFLGPSLGAILVLLTQKSVMPPAVAGVIFLVSAVPSMFVNPARIDPNGGRMARSTSIFVQMRRTWRFIKKHSLIRLLLVCRVHSTMLWAAVMPLLTPLSREFGMGEEGTGVFVAAIGLGSLVGPILAPVLFKRMKLSFSMLITGLMAPLATILIALLRDVPVIATLVLIAVISLACAGLKVIINTAFQRVTPEFEQGSMFGAEQALLGFGWIIALAVITMLMSPIMPGFDLRTLFLFIGVGGFLMFSSCWFVSRRELHKLPSVEESMRRQQPSNNQKEMRAITSTIGHYNSL
jgi:MFS family permease